MVPSPVQLAATRKINEQKRRKLMYDEQERGRIMYDEQERGKIMYNVQYCMMRGM